jgi:hypothetical protein
MAGKIRKLMSEVEDVRAGARARQEADTMARQSYLDEVKSATNPVDIKKAQDKYRNTLNRVMGVTKKARK